MRPLLFILSGLPATGKSTLAQSLARRYGAVWLRIDTIEQALREAGLHDLTDEGYRLAYALAADNLRVGNHVIADCCNPIPLTRHQWMQTAAEAHSLPIAIEIICSDCAEHRQRVENRPTTVAGMRLPSWDEVIQREYIPWNDATCIVIDTAHRTVEASVLELLEAITKRLADEPFTL